MSVLSQAFERLSGFVLRDPGLVWLVLLLPAALWVRGRGGAAVRFAPAALWAGGAMPRSLRAWFLPLPRVLQTIGLVCIVLALARPALRTALPLESEGVDIFLCIDTSSSMTSTDLDRRLTRLELGCDAATEFVRGRPDDRIGLLSFARFPELRCPLTRDHDALERILADVDTVDGDGPEDATGIGTAVARAAQLLGSSASPSRVVILLTDGEENVALKGQSAEIAPAHAAQLCERLGVRVYTIALGIGRRESGGRLVKLDTRPIRDMAERTGGTFHEVRDAGSMAKVYARIDTLERASFYDPRYVFEDRYLVFLALGLALLLLGRVLSATVLDVLP